MSSRTGKNSTAKPSPSFGNAGSSPMPSLGVAKQVCLHGEPAGAEEAQDAFSIDGYLGLPARLRSLGKA